MNGPLTTGLGIAELFDSGEGIVVLFLVTVLVVVFFLHRILSDDRLYERVEKLMRIAHGKDDAVSERREPIEARGEKPTAWRRRLSRSVRRQWKRRPMPDRPRAQR